MFRLFCNERFEGLENDGNPEKRSLSGRKCKYIDCQKSFSIMGVISAPMCQMLILEVKFDLPRFSCIRNVGLNDFTGMRIWSTSKKIRICCRG
jgi:hypothetical protein